MHFNRIIINDSTGFNLTKEFANEFAGTGGSASSSAIIIQLQYELLSGSFMRLDIFSGTNSDVNYLDIMGIDKERGDLILADFGYLKVDYLKALDKSGASFISKVKS
ncbi:transposase, partial [Cetobacterium somerae]|nr:transposase [Cetobacterium somerae]